MRRKMVRPRSLPLNRVLHLVCTLTACKGTVIDLQITEADGGEAAASESNPPVDSTNEPEVATGDSASADEKKDGSAEEPASEQSPAPGMYIGNLWKQTC